MVVLYNTTCCVVQRNMGFESQNFLKVLPFFYDLFSTGLGDVPVSFGVGDDFASSNGLFEPGGTKAGGLAENWDSTLRFR